jgi:uncharacterized protein (DUF1015 family)
MPDIQPFRGLRYNLGQVGSLSDVIAPPYDVIDEAFQEALYKKHPCNVVRLILNRQEPGDDEQNNRYRRAKRFVKNWREEGVLFQEQHPAIYVYHQVFTCLGQEYTRRGFMAGCKAEPFGKGSVFPHEQTMSGPKIDRLMLTSVCKMNMSQVFGLYPDEENKAQAILEKAIEGETPVEATDHLGVVHRLWAVTDPSVLSEVVKEMAQRPVFIADGHHRYETACNYRRQLADAGELTSDHPGNDVLMMFVAMEDPGLFVLPTHRLFPGLPDLTSTELIEKLGDCFQTHVLGEGPELAEEAWGELETCDQQNLLALYARADDKWVRAELTEAGRRKLAEVAEDHHPEWQELGVSILHRLVIETLLEQPNPPKPKYVHLVEEVVEGLKSGDYPLAALVMPATVDHIKSLSLMGERMPPKSTYFYPKLISGLVFKSLEP